MGLVLRSQSLVAKMKLNFCPVHLRGQTVVEGPFQGAPPSKSPLILLQFSVVAIMVLTVH